MSNSKLPIYGITTGEEPRRLLRRLRLDEAAAKLHPTNDHMPKRRDYASMRD